MLADSYDSAESLLFARGFLLWDSSLPRPAVLDRLKWDELSRLPEGWNFAHSNTIDVSAAHNDAGTILLVGGGVATDVDTASSADLATWLAAAPSNQQFQQSVDAICGRFAVFRLSPHRLWAQNDAQGLRAVFHTDTIYPAVVGSHAHLVGEVVGAPSNAFARPKYHEQTNLRTPPGRHTTRHGIYSVLPNTELEMPSRQVRRIYPRVIRRQRPTSELLPSVEGEIKGCLRLLVESGNPIFVSLSAGLDTRLTLALLREYLQHVKFFTYDVANVRNRANQFDTSDALRLAASFNLPHTMLHVDGGAPPEIKRVLAVNRHRPHAVGLAVRYRESFPSNAIHLRSNGNGTLTAWYSRDGWPDVSVTPEYRMQLASRGKCFDLGVLDAFTDSWQASESRKVEALEHSGLDFAYAEDRMGTWHQNIVQESDIAFETRVPFGSRRLIDRMLSAPLEDRRSGRFFVSMIRRLWPELLAVPINGVLVPAEGDSGVWPSAEAADTRRRVLSRNELLERP